MLTCQANGCASNESTKIEGRDILLFPFPENTTHRSQWLKNCQLKDVIEENKPMYLCELHFDKSCCVDSRELIADAVPTIFDTKDDGQRKRKAQDRPEIDLSEIPPLKQKKMENEDNHISRMSIQSPSSQLSEETEKTNDKHKMNVFNDTEIQPKETSHVKSEMYQKIEVGKKMYRLTIQIDKIYGKPGPKSRKLRLLAQLMRGNKEFPEEINNSTRGIQSAEKENKKAICAKVGCKLKKSIYDSKPAFQCEHCDKYYVMKKNDNQVERNTCTVCQKVFSSSQSLCLHSKTHFLCDMCQTDCSSQVTYDKHVRLHVSTDPLKPYKCHKCIETFELRDNMRQHYSIVHPTVKLQNSILQMSTTSLSQQVSTQQDYRCISCNVTFRNEQAYRNHTSSHKKKESLRCGIADNSNNVFPVPNPLTGSQIGILRAVKFSCRVCSMEFDNVGEVDKHTRTHLEEDSEEDRKCNICKKLFQTNVQLNEHLHHHSSHAHFCPICSKAFINETTLKIHLQMHTEI